MKSLGSISACPWERRRRRERVPARTAIIQVIQETPAATTHVGNPLSMVVKCFCCKIAFSNNILIIEYHPKLEIEQSVARSLDEQDKRLRTNSQVASNIRDTCQRFASSSQIPLNLCLTNSGLSSLQRLQQTERWSQELKSHLLLNFRVSIAASRRSSKIFNARGRQEWGASSFKLRFLSAKLREPQVVEEIKGCF